LKKFEIYLTLFFLSISLLSILFLYNNYIELAPIRFVEWLNNYNYGFIRRGLFGTLSFIVSKNLKIDIFILILILQAFFYFLFYFFSLKILLNIKEINFTFLLVLLSPLGFTYPLSEIAAIGRQEVIFLSLTGLFFYSLLKNKKIISQLILFILIPISLLTHEGTMVYLPYLIFANFIFLNKDKIKINLILIIYTILLIVLFLSSIDKNVFYVESICSELTNKIDFEKCKNLNGFAKILDYDGKALDQFLGMFQVFPVIKNIFFLIIGYTPLALIINNNIKVNILSLRINPRLVFLICFILTLPIFTAADWGRWIYINYICSIFLFIFLVDKKIVELNNSNVIKYLDNLSNKFKIFIIMVFCFSWNLKLLHTDDIGSLSFYRVLRKSFGLISNLFF
jgi:hypothetical protein